MYMYICICINIEGDRRLEGELIMRSMMELRKFQSAMRKNPTVAEKIFISRLRQLGIGYKFQVIFGFYILDFVIPEKLLVIEIDGKSHEGKNSRKYDEKRSVFVVDCGLTVVRIKNGDVSTFDMSLIVGAQSSPLSSYWEAVGKSSAARSNVENQKAKIKEWRAAKLNGTPSSTPKTKRKKTKPSPNKSKCVSCKSFARTGRTLCRPCAKKLGVKEAGLGSQCEKCENPCFGRSKICKACRRRKTFEEMYYGPVTPLPSRNAARQTGKPPTN